MCLLVCVHMTEGLMSPEFISAKGKDSQAQLNNTKQTNRKANSPHVREVLDPQPLSVELESRIPIVSEIPDSTRNIFLDSSFH